MMILLGAFLRLENLLSPCYAPVQAMLDTCSAPTFRVIEQQSGNEFWNLLSLALWLNANLK